MPPKQPPRSKEKPQRQNKKCCPYDGFFMAFWLFFVIVNICCATIIGIEGVMVYKISQYGQLLPPQLGLYSSFFLSLAVTTLLAVTVTAPLLMLGYRPAFYYLRYIAIIMLIFSATVNCIAFIHIVTELDGEISDLEQFLRKRTTEEYLMTWEKLHAEEKCCGVTGISDWEQGIPKSCCPQISVNHKPYLDLKQSEEERRNERSPDVVPKIDLFGVYEVTTPRIVPLTKITTQQSRITAVYKPTPPIKRPIVNVPFTRWTMPTRRRSTPRHIITTSLQTPSRSHVIENEEYEEEEEEDGGDYREATTFIKTTTTQITTLRTKGTYTAKFHDKDFATSKTSGLTVEERLTTTKKSTTPKLASTSGRKYAKVTQKVKMTVGTTTLAVDIVRKNDSSSGLNQEFDDYKDAFDRGCFDRDGNIKACNETHEGGGDEDGGDDTSSSGCTKSRTYPTGCATSLYDRISRHYFIIISSFFLCCFFQILMIGCLLVIACVPN